MTAGIVAGLLALLVLACSLAAIGLLRLSSPLDRLHAASLANAAAAILLPLVAFGADGASVRAFKTLLIGVLLLVGGAVATHAAGRAILLRDQADRRDPAAPAP